MDWTRMFGADGHSVQTDSEATKSSSGREVSPKLAGVPHQPIIEVAHGAGSDLPGPKYKRGRGKSFFSEAPKKGAVCQVPGCDRSLHKLKDYYKRYKICPFHLELSQLVVEGQSIRFCQQCGRFQLLDDFDGDRRSCRRKLEKHNERRRRYETASDGSKDDNTTEPPLRRQRSSNSPSMAGDMTKYAAGGGHSKGSGMDPAVMQHLQGDVDLSQSLSPQLLMSLQNPTAWETSLPHPPPRIITTAPTRITNGSPANNNHLNVNPALAAVLAETAQRTSPPLQQQQQQQQQQQPNMLLQALLDQVERHTKHEEQEAEVGVVQGNNHHTAFGGGGGDGYNGATSAEHPMSGVVMQNGTAGRLSPGNGIGHNHTHMMGGGGRIQQQQQQQRPVMLQPQMIVNPSRPVAVRPPVPAPPAVAPPGSISGLAGAFAGSLFGFGAATGGGGGSGGGATTASGGGGGTNAHQLLALLGQLIDTSRPVGNAQEQHLVTLSMKLFNSHPSQLPNDVIHELTSWMAANPSYMEIATRPGCVHLTASVLLTTEERQQLHTEFILAVKQLLREKKHIFTDGVAGEDILIQLEAFDARHPSQAAFLCDSKLKAVMNVPQPVDKEANRAALIATVPLAVDIGYTGSIVLFAAGGDGRCERGLVCRSHGTHPMIEVHNAAPVYTPERRNADGEADLDTAYELYHNGDDDVVNGGDGGSGDHQSQTESKPVRRWMEVRVPGRMHPGAYQFELQQNAMLSLPQTVVALPCPAAVAEVRQLESDVTAVDDVAEFLGKLGVVIHAIEMRDDQDQHEVDDSVLTEVEMERCASAACDIATVCVVRDWPAVLELVMPAMLWGGGSEKERVERAAANIARRLQGATTSSVAATRSPFETVAPPVSSQDVVTARCAVGYASDEEEHDTVLCQGGGPSGSSGSDSISLCKSSSLDAELLNQQPDGYVVTMLSSYGITAMAGITAMQWGWCVGALQLFLHTLMWLTAPELLPRGALFSSCLSLVLFTILCLVLLTAASAPTRLKTAVWGVAGVVLAFGVWALNPVSRIAPGPAVLPLLLLLTACGQAQIGGSSGIMVGNGLVNGGSVNGVNGGVNKVKEGIEDGVLLDDDDDDGATVPAVF